MTDIPYKLNPTLDLAVLKVQQVWTRKADPKRLLGFDFSSEVLNQAFSENCLGLRLQAFVKYSHSVVNVRLIYFLPLVSKFTPDVSKANSVFQVIQKDFL